MQCQLIPFKVIRDHRVEKWVYVRNFCYLKSLLPFRKPEQGDMVPSHIAVAGYDCQISVKLKVSCYLFGLKRKIIVPADEAVIRIIAKSLST